MDADAAGKALVAFYNAWNERIPKGEEWDETLSTWHRFLSDLEVEEVRYAYKRLVAQDSSWLPRPGTVRKIALSRRPDAPPREWEAWAQLRRLAEASHTGVGSSETAHPLVIATLSSLGGTKSLELHTNGDRELFFRAYRETVLDWETANVGLP